MVGGMHKPGYHIWPQGPVNTHPAQFQKKWACGQKLQTSLCPFVPLETNELDFVMHGTQYLKQAIQEEPTKMYTLANIQKTAQQGLKLTVTIVSPSTP